LEATRRSFNKDFLLALAADFKKHGAAAIEKVRKQQPAAYMKICALLVPREMKVEHAGGVKAMTDDAIVAAIAAIEEMLAQRQAGANAKGDRGGGRSRPELASAVYAHHGIVNWLSTFLRRGWSTFRRGSTGPFFGPVHSEHQDDLPVGAGGQLFSLSAPGVSFWMQNVD
jgi:hypothetical protein